MAHDLFECEQDPAVCGSRRFEPVGFVFPLLPDGRPAGNASRIFACSSCGREYLETDRGPLMLTPERRQELGI